MNGGEVGQRGIQRASAVVGGQIARGFGDAHEGSVFVAGADDELGFSLVLNPDRNREMIEAAGFIEFSGPDSPASVVIGTHVPRC